MLHAEDAYALYVEGLSIRAESVAEARGQRPWVADRTLVRTAPPASAIQKAEVSSGGLGRRAAPVPARGLGRRCASRSSDWRLRAPWSPLAAASGSASLRLRPQGPQRYRRYWRPRISSQ